MRRLLREHSFVVQLMFTLTGILFIIIGFPLFENKTVLALVEGIGGALIIASLVGIFQGLFGIDVLTQIEQKLHVAIQAQEMGLTAIHPHIGDESIFTRFEHARSILIMYNTAKNTIYRYHHLMRRAIIEQGCVIKILVGNPENPALQTKEICEGLCPGSSFASEVIDAVAIVKKMAEDLKKRTPPPKAGSIEIRYYPCILTGSLVIVDNELARHTPYMPYAHSSEVPSFDASSFRGGKLFQNYLDTYQRVWEKSTPVFSVYYGLPPDEPYITLHLNEPPASSV